MRSEDHVLDQLVYFAEKDERVRAVILNGSRVNANAPRDIFRDYDVAFAVTDLRHFVYDQSWIPYFGNLIMMQQNECEKEDVKWCCFLMLFQDGVRIDLSFYPIEHLGTPLEDSLKKALLDKDGLLTDIEPASEASYLTSKPSKEDFEKTINNFWWCSTNVAKGLWRDELCYAKYMYDVIVHGCLIKLLVWHVGMHCNWQINTGTYAKWLKKHLPSDLWLSFEKTYPDAQFDNIWKALFEAGKLTRKIGIELARGLGCEYPMRDDQKVVEYLHKVKALSPNAQVFRAYGEQVEIVD